MPHIHELIDFTAEVFIVYQNKVLLRRHDKYDIWLSIGGHIELDEEPNEAAVREVKEEVGLDVELYSDQNYEESSNETYKELIPPEFMNIHNINETHKHVALVYFARSNSDKLILSEREITKDCRWFSEKELEDPKYGIKEHIIIYAKTALEKLKE